MSGLPDTILKGGHQRTKQSLVPIGPVVSEMKIFGITNGPFHQSLVLSGQVVSEENIFSDCVRTDDRRKVMTKAHLTLKRGCILFPIRDEILKS